MTIALNDAPCGLSWFDASEITVVIGYVVDAFLSDTCSKQASLT
jgi:hypothetical protein